MHTNTNRQEGGSCLKFRSEWPREKFHTELVLASRCMPAAARQLQTLKCAFLLLPHNSCFLASSCQTPSLGLGFLS